MGKERCGNSIGPTTVYPCKARSIKIRLNNPIQAAQSPGTQHAQATLAFPTNLINIIGDITGQPSPAPMKQEFAFELTKEAAEKNYCVLKNMD